jgi:hypothetical protein
MSVHDRRASRNQSSDSGWANGEIEKEPLRTAAAKLLKPSKKKKQPSPSQNGLHVCHPQVIVAMASHKRFSSPFGM